MRSLRIGEETWPLAAAPPQDKTIYLDEDVTITLKATGAALSMTCARGGEATITVVRAGEVVLEQTIKL